MSPLDHPPATGGMTPTPEQARIIEHPLEPLRVTAGAGTGKTTTIALRLAHLIEAHGLDPEQALGITFTNKATEELASRLRECLPQHTSNGHEVQVVTYHGFAYSLLREFGPLLGIPREPRIIPTGYIRQMLRDALVLAPPSSLDLTQPGSRVDGLAKLLSVLGDHLREPSDLIEDTDDPVAFARAEMAAVLDEYARRKRALGAIDYADMVMLAHELVSDEEIAGRVRDRYRVVLLDEYQDTNPGQRELLRSVFGNGFPVTAVGDSDQTIYEWRGASPANFADFPVHFPLASGDPAPTLELSTNWRSARAVVETANAVRSHIARPSGLDALVPRPEAPQGAVRTHWLRTAVDEASWIADEALRLHDGGRRWSDIAILFRKHRQMSLVRDALTDTGIPVEVASLGGLLDVPEVADLHAWLRVLGNPDDDIALARLLLGVGFRLGLGDLAPLARWAKARRRQDDEEAPLGWALLESIDDLDTLSGLSEEARTRLARFASLHRDLLEAAQGASLVELCRLILDRTGAWPEIDALGDAARLSARLNLYRFLDLAEGWSPMEGSPSLPAFIDYLELLVDDGADDALDTANVSGEDAVLLITVHRAKGLEWPVVFLPALVAGTFPSNVSVFEDPDARAEIVPHHLRLDSGYLLPLPDAEEARREELRQRNTEQEWRTAYVAVTRARDDLIATGAFWYSTGVHRNPSPLFDTIDAAADAEPGRCVEPGTAPESLRYERKFLGAPDPAFPEGWQEALASAVADPSAPERWADAADLAAPFRDESRQLRLMLEALPEPPDAETPAPIFGTSVTGALTFASCPRRFHWAHVDRLPRRPSPAARRGTDIHRRIELDLRGTLAFADIEADRPVGPPGRASTQSAYATFRRSRFAGMKPILIEAPFSLRIGEARLGGRVDAVFEPEPDLWEVVDFKSGRATDDPSRHIQLEAYALAVAEAGFLGGRVPERIRVTFAYLGDDEVVEVTEDVDPTWLADARSRLEELLERAADGDKEPTPSEACRWCDFSRFCAPGTQWLTARP